MIPQRRADVMSRELPSGEAALLTPDNRQLVLLNELGAIVWDLCDGVRTCADIAALLSERFPAVGREQIERDVAALLGELGRLGALRAQEGDGPCGAAGYSP